MATGDADDAACAYCLLRCMGWAAAAAVFDVIMNYALGLYTVCFRVDFLSIFPG